MPIIKSAIKRVRQASGRRSHNLQVKRAVNQDIRALTDAITAGDAKVVEEKLRAAVSEIDRAVKKGTLHKNTAGRRKSQLARAANAVGGTKTAAAPKTAKAPAKPKAATQAKGPAKKAPAASTKLSTSKKPAASKAKTAK
jgi:small subunit ribosomal protein S20